MNIADKIREQEMDQQEIDEQMRILDDLYENWDQNLEKEQKLSPADKINKQVWEQYDQYGPCGAMIFIDQMLYDDQQLIDRGLYQKIRKENAMEMQLAMCSMEVANLICKDQDISNRLEYADDLARRAKAKLKKMQ